jgi:hypothetical protein
MTGLSGRELDLAAADDADKEEGDYVLLGTSSKVPGYRAVWIGGEWTVLDPSGKEIGYAPLIEDAEEYFRADLTGERPSF